MIESRLSKFVQIFVFLNASSRRQCGSKNKCPRSIGIKIFTRPFPITLNVRILVPICTNNHPFVIPSLQLYPLEETKRDVINKDRSRYGSWEKRLIERSKDASGTIAWNAPEFLVHNGFLVRAKGASWHGGFRGFEARDIVNVRVGLLVGTFPSSLNWWRESNYHGPWSPFEETSTNNSE